MKQILFIFMAVCLVVGVPLDVRAQESVETVYTLGAGDKLRVTVFGEGDLSGEYEIDGEGNISMPLVGDVKAKNITSNALEKLIAAKYLGDYLIAPKVTIEVLNFRPFFIMGEVKSPGGYPHVSGLNVLNAVAIGGGYTARAKEGSVIIHRRVGEKLKEMKANESSRVFPGDTVRVSERFF
jgi:protein involved in polysaccharide export with SLBB domain